MTTKENIHLEYLSNIKEVKKDLVEYKQTRPVQLTLFEVDEQNKEKYSKTAELYDVIPKYHFGGVERKMNQYLDILERDFKDKGQEYKLLITPAAIIDRKSGKTIHYYPSQREELVEDALRRIAATKKRGLYLDNDSGVRFTLYELQQELQKVGHGYNIAEIKEAIEVCNNVILKITSKHGNEVAITSAIFPFVAMETSDRIKGGKNGAVIMFHPLVTKSIDNNTHRLINYQKLMSYKMSLSRYLHKRISHNFTQANSSNPYTIKMTNLVRDSGMREYERNSDTLKQITACLEEMKNFKTLSEYVIHKEWKGRAIIDATLQLTVSDEFISEIKKANKVKNAALEYMGSVEFAETIEVIKRELEKPVFGLTKVIILNILSKLKTKEDFGIITNALAAAREFIESKPDCNAAATTRSAIRDGWKPKSRHEKNKEEKISTKPLTTLPIKGKIKNRDKEWGRVKNGLKKAYNKETYEKWLSKLELHHSYDSEIIMSVPSKFLRDWIKREYMKVIKTLWVEQGVEVEKVRVNIICTEELNRHE